MAQTTAMLMQPVVATGSTLLHTTYTLIVVDKNVLPIIAFVCDQCFLSCCSDVYSDGAGICNMLWGSSFFYSEYSSTDPDSERQCLIPSFPTDQPNPNDAAVANLFADDINNGCMLTVGVSGAYTFVLLSLVAILLMLQQLCSTCSMDILFQFMVSIAHCSHELLSCITNQVAYACLAVCFF